VYFSLSVYFNFIPVLISGAKWFLRRGLKFEDVPSYSAQDMGTHYAKEGTFTNFVSEISIFVRKISQFKIEYEQQSYENMTNNV
jgi:hypothetical protein